MKKDKSKWSREANESVKSRKRSPNGERKNLQHQLASERNLLRWEYQKKYENATIEMFINEDPATKERRSIRMAVKLSEIVLNLQLALHSDVEHDFPKATESLQKLLKEPFTTMSLLYAPCIVKTVYLCCRYIKSGEIRAVAEKCYRRFRPCFGVPHCGTFETTFEAAVRNFWEKQNTVICDTAKYDYRRFTMNDKAIDMKSEETGLNPECKSLVIKDEVVKLECEAETGNSQNLKRENCEEIEIEFNPNNACFKEKTAMDIKAECESEIDKSHYCNVTIKEELVDSDEIIIPNCNVEHQCVSDMLQISIKSEPTDFGNLYGEYKSVKCEVPNCFIKEESISDIKELSVILEHIDFEKLNIQYHSKKGCYILNSH